MINTFCTHTAVYTSLSYVLYPNRPIALSYQFKHVVLRPKADTVLIVLRSVFLYITKLDLLRRCKCTADMLDVFCFQCLLHKQTLHVLPAYLNIKHPENVLGNVPIMFQKTKQ